MNVATSVSERKAGTLQGVILLLPVTMAVMGLIVLVPVLPQMMRQFHAVPGAQYLVPLVLTLPALCIAVLAPIAGAIVDAIGRRRTLIGALVIYSVAGVMPIFLNSLTAIIASRIVVGAMESAVVTASTTLIGDYFHGESRERWLANQTAVASISSIFLALLGGALGNLGWRAPFAAYAVGLLYAVGLILWTWEPRKVEQPSTELAGPAAPFPWRAMLPVALLAVFGGVMFFMMQIQVSNLLNDYYGISSPAMLGLFTSTAGLSVAAGTIAYRRMARSRIATQLLVAFGLLGVSYIMMDHAPSAVSLTVWLVANQLGCGILVPSLVVLVMARLPFEVRGRGTGVFMTAWWLGQPLSTQLVAWVRQLVGGSLPAALQIFGLLCLLAASAALASRAATRHSTAVV
jgi:MFS family permease